MHLPYPSRKSSNPAPFIPARSSTTTSFSRRFALPRRYRQHALAIGAFLLIALIWLLTRSGGNGATARRGGAVGMANHVPAGKPPAVLVTVLDEKKFGAKYVELVKENRKLYAERHGTCDLGAKEGRTVGCETEEELLIKHRLRNFLPPSRRLRPPPRALLLDQSRRDAPRPLAIPRRYILLVRGRRHVHHEPAAVHREGRNGCRQTRGVHARRPPGRAA